MTDFYSILGVSRNTPADEFAASVKKAYYRLALKHHPDKCGGSEESKHKFQEIQAAYETLVDPSKREAYDANPSGSRNAHPTTSQRQAQHGGTQGASFYGSYSGYQAPPWTFFEDLEEEITIHKTAAMKEFGLNAKQMDGLEFWTKPSKSTYKDEFGQTQRCPDAHIYAKIDVRDRAIELHGGTWEKHVARLLRNAAIAEKSRKTKAARKFAKERGIETLPSPPRTPPNKAPRKRGRPPKSASSPVAPSDEEYTPSSSKRAISAMLRPATPQTPRPQRRKRAVLHPPPSPPASPSPSKRRRTE